MMQDKQKQNRPVYKKPWAKQKRTETIPAWLQEQERQQQPLEQQETSAEEQEAIRQKLKQVLNK